MDALTPDERHAVEEWYGLLVSCALKRARRLPHSIEIGDLIAWGSFGLVRAIKTFDPSRWAGEFRSYAAVKIHQAITDGLRREHGGKHHGRKNTWRYQRDTPWPVDKFALHGTVDAGYDRVDDHLEAKAVLDALAAQLDADGAQGLRAADVLHLLADGLKGFEVAERLGVHESRVSQIKRRIRPLLIQLLKDGGSE